MPTHASKLSSCLSRLSLALGLGLALMLSSCTSSKSKLQGAPGNLPTIPLYGQARTPAHGMSRADYPFDANGNYVTAWAAEGRSSAGPSDYRASRTHVEDEPPPRRSSSSATSSSSSRPRSVSAASAPPKKKSSTGSSTSSSTPVKKSSRSTVVKSTDTLWGLARKYGTSVEKIKAANGLKGNTIRTGATLRIPN